MRKYPTKEQILQTPVEYSPEELEYMANWKKIYWKKARKHKKIEVRIYALAWLIQILASFRKQKIEVSYQPDLPSACYDPNEKTIHLTDDSIISALHELAHAFYGSSELMACAYSVHLFKKYFPMSFERLRWKGHLLIR